MAQATGDYELKLSVTASNANEAAQTLRSMFTGIRAEARKTQRDVSLMGSTMNKMMRSFQYAAGTYLGVAGVQQALSSVMQGVRQYSQANVDFQKAIGQLVAQGDRSSGEGIRRTKKEVAQLSAALGVGSKEAADFLYGLESGVAGLQNASQVFEDIKEEAIQMAQLKPINIQLFAETMAVAYQNFKDDIKSANVLQNQFNQTIELGRIELDEFSRYAPKVFQAANTVGASLPESLALITGATLQAGSVEDTITGLKNLLIIMDRMAQLEKEGIHLTGTLGEKFAQLEAISKNNPDAIKKIFGTETINTLTAVVNNLDLINSQVEELSKLTDSSDVVGDRLKDRIKNDPAFLEAKKAEADKAIAENPAEFGKGYNRDSWWGTALAKWNAGKSAYTLEYGTSVGSSLGGIAALISGTRIGEMGGPIGIRDYDLRGERLRAEAAGGASTETGRAMLQDWYKQAYARHFTDPEWAKSEAPLEWFNSEEEHKRFNKRVKLDADMQRAKAARGNLNIAMGVTGAAGAITDTIGGGASAAGNRLYEVGTTHLLAFGGRRPFDTFGIPYANPEQQAIADLEKMGDARRHYNMINHQGLTEDEIREASGAVSGRAGTPRLGGGARASRNLYRHLGRAANAVRPLATAGAVAGGLLYSTPITEPAEQTSKYLVDTMRELTDSIRANTEILAQQRVNNKKPGGARQNAVEAY